MERSTRSSNELADYLRKLREDNNMSQKELANKMHFSSPNTVSTIENNIKKIDLELLEKYSQIFNVPLMSLVVRDYKEGQVYIEKEYKKIDIRMFICISLIYFVLMIIQLVTMILKNNILSIVTLSLTGASLIVCLVISIVHTISKRNISRIKIHEGYDIRFSNGEKFGVIRFVLGEVIASISMFLSFCFLVSLTKMPSLIVLIIYIFGLLIVEAIKIVIGINSIKNNSKGDGRALFTISLFQFFALAIWMLIMFIVIIDLPLDLISFFTLIFNFFTYMACFINLLEYGQRINHKEISTIRRE